MKTLKKLASVALIGVMAGSILTGCAAKKQEAATKTKINFPEKTISIICPFGAGGGTDLVTRALAESAKPFFSHPLVVENKTGGAGVIGLTAGMKAQPDGHTITALTIELITLPQMGLAPADFNYKNFTPIGLANIEASAITVKADSPFNTMDDFIKYAKANPSKLKVGNSGSGAIWHLAGIGLEMKTGAKLLHVPFQEGAAQATTALLGGHIDAVAVSAQEVAAHVASGKLKILGIASEKRAEAFPEVKTFKEQGIDLVISAFRGLGVPKDTPAEVTKRLQDEFGKAVKDEKLKELFKKSSLTYVPMTGEEFGKMMDQQNELFKGIIAEYKAQTAK
jgi:tripartite-type tricarboxylate transporter receptor subunit TctC